MEPLGRERFDHIGIPTSEAKEGAVWLEEDGVWLTNPREHPLNVEWVRYAPGSPMPARLQNNLHIAYRVDDLEEAIAGHDVLVAPFTIGDGFVTIAFVEIDGLVVELMRYGDPAEEGWLP